MVKTVKGIPVRSTIPSIAMGQERRCLNQIRRTSIGKDTTLWNGIKAGDFAIAYIMCGQARRREKGIVPGTATATTTGATAADPEGATTTTNLFALLHQKGTLLDKIKTTVMCKTA